MILYYFVEYNSNNNNKEHEQIIRGK